MAKSGFADINDRIGNALNDCNDYYEAGIISYEMIRATAKDYSLDGDDLIAGCKMENYI